MGWHLGLIGLLIGSLDQVALSGLFWAAIGDQLRRFPPDCRPRRLSRSLGWALLALLLAHSVALKPTDTAFIRLLPGGLALGWGLIVVGWRLAPLWREAILVLTLMVPPRLLPDVLQPWIGTGLQTLMAQIATFLLHSGGVAVVREGIWIAQPAGTVEVRYACTGMALVGLLLQLAVLGAIVNPQARLERLGAWAIAIALGLSTLRVVVMTLVVSDAVAFRYWHNGGGSELFSTVALVLFGWFYSCSASAVPTTPPSAEPEP